MCLCVCALIIISMVQDFALYKHFHCYHFVIAVFAITAEDVTVVVIVKIIMLLRL